MILEWQSLKKKTPKLSTIQVEIDLENDILEINAEHTIPLQIQLSYTEKSNSLQNLSNSRVCGDYCETYRYGENVSEWFSNYLERRVHLVRVCETDTRHIKLYKNSLRVENMTQPTEYNSKIAFANESQYLLVSHSSLESLIERMANGDEQKISIDRFRGNFAISGSIPYEEDTWCQITIANQVFDVIKQCSRCQMINIDQKTGIQGNEPLKTLAEYRRNHKGQISFGILLIHNPLASEKPYHLKVGANVKIIKKKV